MNYFEAKAIIRYGLSQLSSRSAHHAFEELCYELARRKIASNLLPATGPVSAGGDQGRDFESFRTFLGESLADAGPFLGLTGNGMLVGACTLEQSPVGKIKSDLAKIFSRGKRPTHIAYFCESNVPVAKRHHLQEFCRETYNAAIEIYDGAAIADMLADPDAAWIAVKFLNLPAETVPIPDFGPQYEQLRQRWIVQKDDPQTFADFIEIKQGLRTATFSNEAKGDLSDWLLLIERFALESESAATQLRAKYEICVAQLRGNGNLDPALGYFRDYLNDMNVEQGVAQLTDAAVLLVYGYGAIQRHATTMSESDIHRLTGEIESLLHNKLQLVTARSERAELLQALALMAPLAHPDDDLNSVKARVLQRWSDLVDAIKDLPLFPVLRVGEMLDKLQPLYGSEPKFRTISAVVDALVAEVTGSNAAGDRARSRSIQLMKEGRRLAAIDELHRVKVDWFTDENLRGFVISLLLLAQLYLELRLYYAARYYAAAAAFIVANKKRDDLYRYLPRALFFLAETFFFAGEGVTFVHSLANALHIHDAAAPEAFDWTKHDDVTGAVTNAAILRAMTKVIAPQHLDLIDAGIDKWPLSDTERTSIRQLSESPPWSEMTADEMLKRIPAEIGTNPLGDIGPFRPIRWAALGVVWDVQYEGGMDRRALALEFASTLQIIQADLAEVDLVIMPSDVTIFLSHCDQQKPEIEQVPDNERFAWKVVMPAAVSDIEQLAMIVGGIALAILRDVSLLSSERFLELVDEHMERGLPLRTFSVRPARELLAFAEPDNSIDYAALEAREPVALDTQPVFSPELSWRNDDGPGYSRETAEELLRNRYRQSMQAIKLTLPRLLENRRCRVIIRELRNVGLLDWQILSIIANIVAQWQIEKKYGRPAGPEDLPDFSRHLKDRLFRAETVDDTEFDLLAFDEQTINDQRRMLQLAALKTWNLNYRSMTPNPEAAGRLLNVRYHHSTDDIEHEDPFPGL